MSSAASSPAITWRKKHRRQISAAAILVAVVLGYALVQIRSYAHLVNISPAKASEVFQYAVPFLALLAIGITWASAWIRIPWLLILAIVYDVALVSNIVIKVHWFRP